LKRFELYSSLLKPEWAPPSWIIGPVWLVLYIGIFITFGMVFVKTWQKQIPFVVALPFILNLLFNLAFGPIQFWLRINLLASADILLVLLTLIWSMAAIFSRYPCITYAQIPYLLWVSFASVVQLTITRMNWSRG